MKKQNLLAGISTFAFGCVAPLVAQAQQAQQATAPTSANAASEDQLQEVIVTAERRVADVQKVALSVTVLSGEALEQHNDYDLTHVLEEVPGVIVQGLTSSGVGGSGGPPLIDIRGIGTDGPNKVSATATYEDGVLIQGGGADFYDLNRVEVLRGPQGTLYGRGATAGALNIITNDPTQTFGGYGQLTLGSYDLVGTQGALNLPVSDVLSTRIAYNAIKHSGFLDSGENGEGESNARAKILFKPNDDFSVLLGGVYYSADETDQGAVTVSAAAPVPAGWIAAESPAGRDVISFKEGYANIQWNLGFANLTYIPSYQATNSNNFNYTSPGLTSAVMPYNNTFTQELRVASPANSLITWIAGAYYFNQHYVQDLTGNAPTGPGVGGYTFLFHFDQVYASSSAGFFGELTYPITSTVRVTGGVRESIDTVYHVDNGLFPPGPGSTVPGTQFDTSLKDYNRFDWKARVETDLAPNNLLYGMVSTGYRPGGVVNGSAYSEETVTAYEIGSKNRVANILTVNGSVFYDDYSGFQVPYSYMGPVHNVVTQVISLPATIYGAELEGVALLTPVDRFNVSVTYLHARFTQNYYLPGGVVYDTNNGTAPHAPTVSLSARFSHSFTLPNGGSIIPAVDGRYQSQVFTDFDPSNYNTTGPLAAPYPAFVQKPYTIGNASLTYSAPSGKYRLTAYGKNLGNVIYKTTVAIAGPPGASSGSAGVDDPRTFGVIIAANF